MPLFPIPIPHIFQTDLYARFARIRFEFFIKYRVLFRRVIVTGVHDDHFHAEYTAHLNRTNEIGKSLFVIRLVPFHKRRKGRVRLIASNPDPVGKRAEGFRLLDIIFRF